MSDQDRKIIFICGMHRCGTSLLTRVLHRHGLSLGDSLDLPAYDNPEGFFENYKIRELNDEILAAQGRAWDRPGQLVDDHWTGTSLETFATQALEVIKKEYDHREEVIVIKDPRISLLIPLWIKISDSLDRSSHFIIMIRHPQAIAASLAQRNMFSSTKVDLMTSTYWISALADLEPHQRTIVDFQELITDPSAAIEALNQKLNLRLRDDTDQSKIYTELINPTLVHHIASEALTKKHPYLIATDIFDTLTTASDPIDNHAIGAYKDQISTWDLTILRALIGADPHFTKIWWDDGRGIIEQHSMKMEISPTRASWQHISIPSTVPIHRLVWQPINHPAKLIWHNMELSLEDSDVKYTITDSATANHGDIYIFEDPDPRIIISFDSPSIVQDLSIDFSFYPPPSSGTDTAHIDQRQRLQKSPWIRALGLLMRHPISLLSQVNKKNIITLQRALKREPPAQIVRNLKKLLTRRKISHSTRIQKDPDAKSNQSHISSHINIPRKRDLEHLLRTKIIYVSPDLPAYDISSGGRRAHRLLTLLAHHHDIYLYALVHQDAQYKDLLVQDNITVLGAYPQEIKSLPSSIDFIIYSYHYTAEDASFLKKRYPEARIIIDSVDINWRKEERAIGTWVGFTDKKVAKNKQQEVQAYREADEVWVVTEEDRDALSAVLPDTKIQIVSNIHVAEASTHHPSESKKMLFIGGYDYYANIAAALYIAHEIFPLIYAVIPEARLIFAGSNPPEELDALTSHPSIEVRGFIPESDMSALYRECTLALVPLTTGSGIKGKICEAISYRLPVLTNDIGNEGIQLKHLHSGLIANQPAQIAVLAIQALRGDFDFQSMTTHALRLLDLKVGPQYALDNAERSLFPPITIAIVTYDKKGLLSNCIESILAHTRYPHYRILVYSNNCTDGSQDLLKIYEDQHDHIEVIYATQNDVYVKPNNDMMSRYPKDDIVLLNNDVEVTEAWLTGMYRQAYKSKSSGIVGCKVLYKDGRLQEYGSAVYEDGSGINIGKDSSPSDPDFGQAQYVGYVSGCAMYIKRSTIEKIGPFDEIYHPCYYEDSDFCYRAWQQGIKTMVTPDSKIYHIEGATAGNDPSSGMKKYQAINKDKFLKRHHNHLRATNKAIYKSNQDLANI